MKPVEMEKFDETRIREEALASYRRKLDELEAEVAAQFSRGSVYIQQNAMITDTDLAEIRRSLYSF